MAARNLHAIGATAAILIRGARPMGAQSGHEDYVTHVQGVRVLPIAPAVRHAATMTVTGLKIATAVPLTVHVLPLQLLPRL